MSARTHFGPEAATAIDLSTRDMARASTHAERIEIVGPQVAVPFGDLPLHPYRRGSRLSLLATLWRLRPDVIVVQQEVTTASLIARLGPPARLAVHRRHTAKQPKPGLRRWWARRRFDRLDALFFNSEFCRQDFHSVWPEVTVPTITVANGLDAADWVGRPPDQREGIIAFTGRAHPDKGALPLARALVPLLARHAGWRAHFMLSRSADHPETMLALRLALAPVAARVEIALDQPHDAVRDLLSRAAIAVVPSIYAEPFGRAALEAMAAGAVTVSSMRGGLAEVVGNAGVAAEPEAGALERALEDLIGDPARRAWLSDASRARAAERFSIAATGAAFDVGVGLTMAGDMR
ncbi:MAG: glycosyltransferase family 4 protein [Pseudomonadota bacterium]